MLALLATSHTEPEIAAELGISPATAHRHVYELREAVGCETGRELGRWWQAARDEWLAAMAAAGGGRRTIRMSQNGTCVDSGTMATVADMNAMPVFRVLLPVLAALSISAAAFADAPEGSDAPGGCYVPQGGPPHTADGTPCTPPPPSPQDQKIHELDVNMGALWLEYADGKATRAQLEQANAELAAARGLATPPPLGSFNQIAAGVATTLGIPAGQQNQQTTTSADVQRALAGTSGGVTQPNGVQPAIPPGVFFPFEQVTSYYCGPASAETVLYYLFGGEYRIAANTDPKFAPAPWFGYPSLVGDAPAPGGLAPSGPAWDQGQILADPAWLNTDYDDETGYYSMQNTLNRWMGWAAYTNMWTGGNYSQTYSTQVFDAITNSVSSGYPVADNVIYRRNDIPSDPNADSYTPPGFSLGDYSYGHFDVIYGTYAQDWLRHVEVGQVYDDQHPGQLQVGQPYQDYFWDWGSTPHHSDHYQALAIGNGVILY